jgi:hypothetical protein
MRIEFKDLNGRHHVRRFTSWTEMCYWLKIHYPFVGMSNDARRLKRDFRIFSAQILKDLAL